MMKKKYLYLLTIFLSFFLLTVNAEVNNDSECFFEHGSVCLSKEKYIDIFEKGYDQELIDMWNNLYNKKIKLLVNFLSYSDGKNTVLDIANLCNEPFSLLYNISEILLKYKLIKIKKISF